MYKRYIAGGGGMLLIYLGMIETPEDKDKFEYIYNNYKFKMIEVARRYVNDHALAEDVVHDSFIKIISNLEKIEDVSCSKTFAYIVTVVKNKSIDYLRSEKTKRTDSLDGKEFFIHDNESLPLDLLIEKEGYERLLSCIDELDEKYRAVLELKYIHGLKEKEIADVLNITEKNANVRIYRARKMLINKIEGGAGYDK